MIEPSDIIAPPLGCDKLEISTRCLQRLWSKIEKRGPNECWPWLAARDNDGYGRFWLHGGTGHVTRVVFGIIHRALLPHELACHSCDNPPCCNPAHLFAGTHLVNHQDRDAKGRKAPTHGELNGQSKLTAEIIREIRQRVAGGEKPYRICKEYGVVDSAIRNIAKGRRWKHII